ncbi:protein-L-isoaspartate(D-aspartate) O-methyltransferase [Catenovulum sp. 2E275]|uniref:protein-L-isoaspartate(D-aspartate) O-methyltransferase n=1 Tax=Catenovulum sp. 2E275 TaxID=2980497 RepID=UPI0021D124F9|nr:protein-L-isoaspartate(D-aspartate) O-methyltransferase [Catenovulum sp. 2E275]MCU4676911.1 protein-L-isoaspartate(D-aspartate) O-methyltransferase [Catenovulum sp. 2E275]
MSLTLNKARSGEKLAQLLMQVGIKNHQVLEAIARVPREAFVQPALTHKAYENTALPIGKGQTISQPAIVARMTEIILDADKPIKTVLEIGTGCGYQTAVLAQLVDKVCTVERIASLQFQAKRVLRQLDLHNISFKHGDGWKGWINKAPFDAILVTAAAATLPTQLLEQLTDGGVMVIPIGTEEQILKKIIRNGDDYKITDVANVKFVPLVAGETE